MSGVRLEQTPGGLALVFNDPKRGKPYYVDFQSAVWKARFQQGLAKGHIFRRALGGEPCTLVDATAGFGQDAMMAVAFGCTVTAVERSPEVAAVLRDGVERARREDEALCETLSRLTVVEADAAEYLAGLSDRPAAVYIDPMFDKPKKSAKSPKEMQLLQELLPPPHPEDEARLFQAAMAAALERVIVKRPLKARAPIAPSHSFKGQSIRYDVYLVAQR